MDITEYKPNKFNKKYNENKIVLRLFFGRKINDNIIKKIDEYIEEYSKGFSLFKNNISGNPFELIIRIISKYIKKTSNDKLNKILKKIRNIPNHEKYDIIECKNFFQIKYFNPFIIILNISENINLNINILMQYTYIVIRKSLNNILQERQMQQKNRLYFRYNRIK